MITDFSQIECSMTLSKKHSTTFMLHKFHLIIIRVDPIELILLARDNIKLIIVSCYSRQSSRRIIAVSSINGE